MAEHKTIGRRVVVVGNTGSGKTTLARHLAAKLGLPHVELDALHWEPDWQEAPLDVFRARIVKALSGDGWIVDGNYGKVRDIVWPRADTLIWLDYPLHVSLRRLIPRTLRRALTGEVLWGNNRESARVTFFSRDSILLWALTSHRRRRKSYPLLLVQAQHAHLTVLRFRSPHATAAWLARL
jgi:adenylate kinase family enzyme